MAPDNNFFTYVVTDDVFLLQAVWNSDKLPHKHCQRVKSIHGATITSPIQALLYVAQLINLSEDAMSDGYYIEVTNAIEAIFRWMGPPRLSEDDDYVYDCRKGSVFLKFPKAIALQQQIHHIHDEHNTTFSVVNEWIYYWYGSDTGDCSIYILWEEINAWHPLDGLLKMAEQDDKLANLLAETFPDRPRVKRFLDKEKTMANPILTGAEMALAHKANEKLTEVFCRHFDIDLEDMPELGQQLVHMSAPILTQALLSFMPDFPGSKVLHNVSELALQAATYETSSELIETFAGFLKDSDSPLMAHMREQGVLEDLPDEKAMREERKKRTVIDIPAGPAA